MPCISLEGWSGAGPLTDLRISVALYARCGNLVCGNWGLSLCLRSVRIMALRGVTAARSVGVGVGMGRWIRWYQRSLYLCSR